MSTLPSITDVMSWIQEILSLVQQAQIVVIHCMGALGPTGIITACCVVALGNAPQNAIVLVRHTRQYTVETRQPEAFVYQFAQQYNLQYR